MQTFRRVPPQGFGKRRLFFFVGTWLSLVEHSLGVRGVGSSNLPVPTILFEKKIFLLNLLGELPTRAPQCVARAKRAPGKACEGLWRAQLAVQICPSRPIFFRRREDVLSAESRFPNCRREHPNVSASEAFGSTDAKKAI